MSVYSFSQIQTYLQCPLKYKFLYIDKIKPDFEENLHLILGTEVHSTLEYLYEKVNNMIIPSYTELENIFVENFNKKASLLDEDKKKEIDTFISRGKYYIKSYYDKYYPFDNIKIIGTELSFYVDLGDDIKFQGFIDRLDKKGDDFILTDYKTNKNLPPEDKSFYEEQLTLYALGVKQKYGKYLNKIYGNLIYLHFDIQDFWEISDNKINEITQKYKQIAQEINKKKVEYNLGNKDVFKENENPNCKFCDYKEICPLFSHLLGKFSIEEFSDDSIRGIIEKYVNLNKQKKEIENEMEDLRKILIDFAIKNNLKKLYGNNNTKISISSSVNYKILDKEKLKQYLKEHNLLDSVLDVDRFKLKKIIEDKNLTFDKLIIEKNTSFILRT